MEFILEKKEILKSDTNYIFVYANRLIKTLVLRAEHIFICD